MPRKPFSDEIREAIDSSGMSRYAICKATGLPQSAMSRFMSGKVGLSLASLDALAEFIGLHAVIRRPKGE
jgi:transcriptional regulator with XRE-family HTH domain